MLAQNFFNVYHNPDCALFQFAEPFSFLMSNVYKNSYLSIAQPFAPPEAILMPAAAATRAISV